MLFKHTKSSNQYLETLTKVNIFYLVLCFNLKEKNLQVQRCSSQATQPIKTKQISHFDIQVRNNSCLTITLKFSKENKFNTRIIAVVRTVTNNVILLNIPQRLNICALKFTENTRFRIRPAKGECFAFDQLTQIASQG